MAKKSKVVKELKRQEMVERYKNLSCLLYTSPSPRDRG